LVTRTDHFWPVGVTKARTPGCRSGEDPIVRLEVLGIEVDAALVDDWARWLAPEVQPFVVGSDDRWDAIDDEGGTVTPEVNDTYHLWAVPKGSRMLWLSERGFSSLPRPLRGAVVREQVVRRRGAVPSVRAWRDVLDAEALRAQADGHRFVWWPSLLERDAWEIVRRVLVRGRLPSRHREVGETTWRACSDVLPHARELAGTFATGSVANCFGTVIAAAGGDITGVYERVDPFVDWLASSCTRGGDANHPGTVLVWRDSEGQPVHAAVTIGDGWVLEKPSQEWHAPRAIVTCDEVVRTTRLPGQRLERHRLRT
jgi:hypothetical protein